jgi:hypothetical protein
MEEDIKCSVYCYREQKFGNFFVWMLMYPTATNFMNWWGYWNMILQSCVWRPVSFTIEIIYVMYCCSCRACESYENELWLTRGPNHLLPSDSAPVLQCDSGHSSTFLDKILVEDISLFPSKTQFYFPLPSLLLHSLVKSSAFAQLVITQFVEFIVLLYGASDPSSLPSYIFPFLLSL